MKIENINIDELKIYKNNAKNHPQSQIERIANSIKKFGFKSPIQIDENNVIIAGHGRYQACLQLGIKEIPAIKINDLSENEIKMLRIADNKVAESDWDLDMLKKELDELNETYNLDDFEIENFTKDEIKDFGDEDDDIQEYENTPIADEIGFFSKFKVIKFETPQELEEFEKKLKYVKSPNFESEKNIELKKEAVITYSRLQEIFR